MQLGQIHTADEIKKGQGCHAFTGSDTFVARLATANTPGAAGWTRPDGKAWHGLGEYVGELDIEQAKKRIGWRVVRSAGISGPVEFAGGETRRVVSDAYNLIVREDTAEVFQCAGAGYQIVQNDELGDIAHELKREGAGTIEVETVGSIQGGARVFYLLRAEPFDIGGKGADTTFPYLLLANAHDGSMALGIIPTAVRVVCKNTLNIAGFTSGNRNGIRIRHTGDMDMKIREARAVLANFAKTTAAFKDAAATLAARSMTREQVQDFFTDVYQNYELEGEIPKNPKTEKERKTRNEAAEIVARWVRNFEEEKDVAGTTAWNAANAITRWYDHQRAYRGKDNAARREVRLNAALFGSSAAVKASVFKAALQLA